MTAGIVGVGLLAWYAYRKGLRGLGQAPGKLITAALDVASDAVGIPGPSDTTTDPQVARWIVDNYGYITASKWAGVPALFSALALPQGSGTPPAPGTPAYAAMPKARIIDMTGGNGSVGWW